MEAVAEWHALLPEMLGEVRHVLDVVARARMRLVCRGWRAADLHWVTPAWTHMRELDASVEAWAHWQSFCVDMAGLGWPTLHPVPIRIQWILTAQSGLHHRAYLLCIKWPIPHCSRKVKLYTNPLGMITEAEFIQWTDPVYDKLWIGFVKQPDTARYYLTATQWRDIPSNLPRSVQSDDLAFILRFRGDIAREPK